jgi:ribose transport system substrate-binding protein
MATAACGDDDEGTGDAPTATTSAAGAGTTAVSGDTTAAGGSEPEFLAAARERLDRWYAGTHRDPPAESPPPKEGVNLWILSCGQAAEGCSVPAEAAREAAEAIGWEVTVFDGKLNPAEYSNGVNSAVAAGADAIILDVVDCQYAAQALSDAKKAGVKIYGLHSLDCSDPAVGGEAVFDAELTYGEEFPNYRELVIGFGGTKADWIIVKTEGKANTIQFNQDELLVVKYIGDGFEKTIATCDTCTVTSVEFVLADLGPPLQQKAEQALLTNPDANSIMVPYDSAMTLGISSAIEASGRKDDLFVMGGEGFVANIQNARDDKAQDAGTGYGFEWEGWASVDGVNRLLSGTPQVDCGCGFAVWDREHNFPEEAGVAFQVPVDFKSNYRKIWGVE